MCPHTRSRLMVGAAILGLATTSACGRKDDQAPPRLVAPGVAAATAPAPASPPPVTEMGKGLPMLGIQADSVVAAGTGGHQAQASGDTGLQYEWFIEGGAFEGETRGPSVAWKAGPPGEVRLFCRGTDPAGKKSVALARVQSEAPPTIDRFEAVPAVITAGRSAKIAWTAREIKTLTLDPGGQDAAKLSGPALEVKPQATTTYTLTATNGSGVSTVKSLVVKVVPPPVITAFRATSAVASGQSVTLNGAFKGGKALMKRGGAALASSESGSIQAEAPALKVGEVFTLVVTNEAGDSVTQTLRINPQGP